jgi:hypothetical protein
VLQEVLKGKELPYRAAIRLGRTSNSVIKKLSRMRGKK